MKKNQNKNNNKWIVWNSIYSNYFRLKSRRIPFILPFSSLQVPACRTIIIVGRRRRVPAIRDRGNADTLRDQWSGIE